MSQVLYPDQENALANLRLAVARLQDARRPQRVLLVSPTGSGKTTIAGAVIAGAVARGGEVLFLAHRKELINQCSARLDGAGIDHGVLMGNHPRNSPWCRVQVASVPTLVRRLDNLPRATLIFVDEARRARAATYTHVLDRYPEAVVIGLDATPWRLDGRGLGELFEEIVVAALPLELIGNGRLVPYTGFAYDMPEMKDVKKSGGDYQQDQAAKVMASGQIMGNVVQQWIAHCEQKRTAVFAVNIAHSMQLADRFRAAGVAAEHVDGDTPDKERDSILARVASGETRVVCNVNLLTDGWDCPEIENIVLARPTMSVALYMQMVGRGGRPICFGCRRNMNWKFATCTNCGSSDIKRRYRIHDHAGAIVRHGLPDAERNYSLDVDPKKKGPKAEAVLRIRRCAKCYAVYSGSEDACPQCGTAHVPKARVIREQDGSPVPIEQLQREANERQEYLELQVSIAEATGKKRGWAAGKYKARYGVWPPSGFWAATRRLSQIRKDELAARVRAAQAGGT